MNNDALIGREYLTTLLQNLLKLVTDHLKAE